MGDGDGLAAALARRVESTLTVALGRALSSQTRVTGAKRPATVP